MTIFLVNLLKGKISLQEIRKKDTFGGYVPFYHHYVASQIFAESALVVTVIVGTVAILKILETASG